ncbi:hypothetical protein, partial [Thermosynechococcus sp.]|uniref:hypothetical protein n=1 Tax=Thermosynechococcus sp. TaxID=2814275 RepID=UPI00391C4496
RLLEEANPSFIKQLLEFVSLPLGVLQLGLYSKNKEIVQQFIIQQTTRQTLQIIAEKQRSETS